MELSVEPLDGLAADRQAWSELAEASGNPFATWEWATTWWLHFGAGRRLRLLGGRRPDGSLAAIFPLYEAAHRPLRVLRLLGHGPADELGPVCAPGDRPAAAAGLRRALAGDLVPYDVLLADRLAAGEPWGEAVGGAVLRRQSSPVIALEVSDWETFLRERSRNFREQVRRRERRLARAHALRFRLTEAPADLPADLATLFRLHDARWGSGDSGALRGARRAFHRDWAAVALARGWLRLWLLELDGQAVAAWYGLRYAGSEWYYQAGRDPAWERASVGSVLLAHTVRAALEDGARSYRLLRGEEGYKARWATGDRPVETRARAAGALGRAAVGAAGLALRLPPAARGPLTRRLG